MTNSINCGDSNSLSNSWWRVIWCNNIPNVCVSDHEDGCNGNTINLCTSTDTNHYMISPCNTNYNNDFFIQNKIVDDENPGILKLFGVSFVESKFPPTIDSISSVTYSDNINGFYNVIVNVTMNTYSSSGTVSCIATTLDNEYLYAKANDIIKYNYFSTYIVDQENKILSIQIPK